MGVMQDSIFTKIIKGELPCHKVYEDDLTIAFLTIHPAHTGHTLVIPKAQVDQYIDLSASDYEALWNTVHKIAARLREVIGKDRVGLVIKGTEVPHTHVHLVPFNNDERLRADDVLDDAEPDHKKLAEIAAKLYIE